MSKLSIIIPSYNEPYLGKTVRDLLNKVKGNIEIFVNLDGDMPEKLVKDKCVKYFHNQVPIGMRGGINLGLKHAKGKYIMKVDAHCLFASGFDEVIKRDCKENWLMIPRRYSLNANGWKRSLDQPVKDYHYFAYPNKATGFGMPCYAWPEVTKKKMNDPNYDIDDTMAFQGSCWFAHRDYFMDKVGFLDDRPETYSTFAGDQLEIGLKYWLTDGQIKVNKKTWYAHLFKNSNYYRKMNQDRHVKTSRATWTSHRWAAKHWINNEEPKMPHTFQWLVEKFWPVPTWPENRNLWHINHPQTQAKSALKKPDPQTKTQNTKPNLRINTEALSKVGEKETPLCELAYKYGTDKCPRIKHGYTPHYYSLFKDIRNSVKMIFEMGIGYYKGIEKADLTYDPGLKRWYQRGASLKMWRDFFPNAQVVGADVQPATLFKEKRIKTYLCDQTNEKQVRDLLKIIGKKIDIFIDDGSHNKDHQVLLAETALPFLKKDVIYIIEDVTYPEYISQQLTKYDCEVVDGGKRWRDDHLVIVKK